MISVPTIPPLAKPVAVVAAVTICLAVALVGVRHKNEKRRARDHALSKMYQERARRAALQRQREQQAKLNGTKQSSKGLPTKGKLASKRKKVKLAKPERFLPREPRRPQAALPAELREGSDNFGDQNTEERTHAEQGQPSLPNLPFCLPVSQTNAGSQSMNHERNEEAIVLRDGLTSFLHIPYLPNSEHAAFMIRRLAKEFLPIIKRRGYMVHSVSEMWCCGDGTRALMGEDRNPNRIKVVTANGREDQCGGYNRTIRLKNGRTMHLIHIRLRDRVNHYRFRTYDEAATTMAHELAHCEQQNHSPAFYKLMSEIKREHADLVSSGVVHEDSTAEEKFGFDIYGQSVSRSRF